MKSCIHGQQVYRCPVTIPRSGLHLRGPALLVTRETRGLQSLGTGRHGTGQKQMELSQATCSAGHLPLAGLALLLHLAVATSPALAQQEDARRVLFEIAATAQAEPARPVGTQSRATGNPVSEQDPRPLETSPLSEIAAFRALMESQVDGGAFSPGLAQTQLALGERYQSLDLHAAAIDAFEQARHLIRIEHGLGAPEQVAVVEQAVQSHLQLGELTEALELHQSLAMLLLGSAGESSLELAETLIRVGDSYQTSADTLKRMPPQSLFRIPRSADNHPGSPQRHKDSRQPVGHDAAQATRLMYSGSEASLLFSAPALEYYMQALSLLAEAQAHTHPRLIEFEYHLMRAIAERYGPSLNYRSGGARGKIAEGLQRVVSHTAYSPGATVGDLARRMLEAGDWHLFTIKRREAWQQYADTLQLLSQIGISESEALHLANPVIPPVIPTLLPTAHSRTMLGLSKDEALAYDGHIDVALRINPYGRTSRIHVVGSSASASPRLEALLLDMLESTRFRPTIDVKGKTRNRDVNLRYHFAYVD